MAILAFPLVISVLKPNRSHFSVLRAGKASASGFYSPLRRRQFTGANVSAISSPSISQHSSTEPKSQTQKASVLTFQQAIQRLQVLQLYLLTMLCLFHCYGKLERVILLLVVTSCYRNIGLPLDVP